MSNKQIKYLKNMLKFSKRYVQTVTDVKKIRRNDYTKISIGHRITIMKTDNSNFYYFFFLGNLLFNLYDSEVVLDGTITINYKELQEKDMYFNSMMNTDIHELTMQDFKDMEYIYKRLNELL